MQINGYVYRSRLNLHPPFMPCCLAWEEIAHSRMIFMTVLLQVSAVLCGFLEYLSRDKLLKRKYGGKVCRCLLSQWSLLGSWWGETFDSDRRLAAVNILKKVLNLEPKVDCTCKSIYREST